jgi:hypothetical protein
MVTFALIVWLSLLAAGGKLRQPWLACLTFFALLALLGPLFAVASRL